MSASIICARVIPSTHYTEVTLDRALAIAMSLDNLQVNVGQLIVDKITKVAQGRANNLVYPSLITRLCYEVRLSVQPMDEENKMTKDVYPLKKRGVLGGQKKRSHLLPLIHRLDKQPNLIRDRRREGLMCQIPLLGSSQSQGQRLEGLLQVLQVLQDHSNLVLPLYGTCPPRSIGWMSSPPRATSDDEPLLASIATAQKVISD